MSYLRSACLFVCCAGASDRNGWHLEIPSCFQGECADCGLTTTEIDGLIAKGVTSMSVLAYTLRTPGVTPDEASLRGLMNSASPGDVTVQTLASIRRLVFESQTLAISQIKSIIEADAEKKIELVPAERATRIKAVHNSAIRSD